MNMFAKVVLVGLVFMPGVNAACDKAIENRKTLATLFVAEIGSPGNTCAATLAPTTVAPITAAPTTVAPTTVAPITAAPTTVAPTTVATTTVAPTTAAPTTTKVPTTTMEPTTIVTTTLEPTTIVTTTMAPTTVTTTMVTTTCAASLCDSTTMTSTSTNTTTTTTTTTVTAATTNTTTTTVTTTSMTTTITNTTTTKTATTTNATTVATTTTVTSATTNTTTTTATTTSTNTTTVTTTTATTTSTNTTTTTSTTTTETSTSTNTTTTTTTTTVTATSTNTTTTPTTTTVTATSTNATTVAATTVVTTVTTVTTVTVAAPVVATPCKCYHTTTTTAAPTTTTAAPTTTTAAPTTTTTAAPTTVTAAPTTATTTVTAAPTTVTAAPTTVTAAPTTVTTTALTTAGCTNACIKMPGDYANSNCNAVGSGQTATCTTKTTFAGSTISTLQLHCMGTSFDVKCPANNGGANTVPYLDSKSVQCKACAVMPLGNGADKNPQPNKYAVTLAWGKNVKTASSSEFWQGFDAYKIIIVDAQGGEVGSPQNGNVVPVKPQTASTQGCCSQTEYSTTVSGDSWPAGGKRFMIVPYDAWKVGNTSMMFTMPFGSVTEEFVDKTEGTASIVKVAPVFEMTETRAKEIFALPRAELYDLARATVHAGVASKGVSLNSVIVTNVELVTPTSTRRLGSTRNLGGHSTKYGLKITTEILLDDTYTGAAIDTAVFKEPEALTAMTTAMVERAISYDVTSVTSVDDVTVNEASIVAMAEDVSVATPVTGAAQSMAGGTLFSTIIALAMAHVGRQFLA